MHKWICTHTHLVIQTFMLTFVKYEMSVLLDGTQGKNNAKSTHII